MTEQKDKPVYKTMVKPHPESIGNLTGFTRPSYAYVLVELPQWNIISDGVRQKTMGLATVNAEGRAEVMHQVDLLLNKGGRILDYGNFPSLSSMNPKRREKAMHYSQGTGINAWDALENHVKRRMAADMNWRDEKDAMEGEMDVLKRKLADEVAKRAAAEEQLIAQVAAAEKSEKSVKAVAERAEKVAATPKAAAAKEEAK